MPAGRPTTYTPELAASICKRMADGETLRAICREEGSPDLTTIYNWRRLFPEFSQQYAIARKDQADSFAEMIIDVAQQDPAYITVSIAGGAGEKQGVDGAEVQHRRLQVDALKWIASKLRPGVYGEAAAREPEAKTARKLVSIKGNKLDK